MTRDRYVVRWIGEDHLRLGAVEQPSVGVWVGRVTADQAVLADAPDIARARDWWAVSNLGGLVGRVRFLVGIKLADQDVDLWGLETGEGDVKIDFDQVLKLDGEQLAVQPAFSASRLSAMT